MMAQTHRTANIHS